MFDKPYIIEDLENERKSANTATSSSRAAEV
jgi:hypothetical protein